MNAKLKTWWSEDMLSWKKICEKLDFCALCFASTNSKVNGNKGETLDQFSNINFIMWSSIAVTKSWKFRNNYGMLKKN